MKTPWYPATINPVRRGWYEVKGCPGFFNCTGRHYWTGTHWVYYVLPNVTFKTRALPWRGLTEEYHETES